jgi:hypothetical protein
VDDHRRLQAGELIVPALPRWEPVARGAASGSVFHHLEDLGPTATAGAVRQEPCELASRGRVTVWDAAPGERLTIPVQLEQSGVHAVHLVGLHRPAAGAFRASLDGEPLQRRDQAETTSLAIPHGTRLLNVTFRPGLLAAGAHELVLECTAPGVIGGDYLWIKLVSQQVPGALEAEALTVTAVSDGVICERQGWSGSNLSGGKHLWVQARQPGDLIELEVPAPRPGAWRVQAYLTRSWDYGIIQLAVDGHPAGEPFDALAPDVVVEGPVDLGVHELGERCTLRATVVGTSPGSKAPHYYFGIDCLVLEPAGR